jgi:hypothetical protein
LVDEAAWSPLRHFVSGQSHRDFSRVFSPKDDWCAKFAVDCLPALAGKSFLEGGAGCGFVSSLRLKAEPGSLGFYKAHEPFLRAELQRAGLQVVSVREERRWGYRCAA